MGIRTEGFWKKEKPILSSQCLESTSALVLVQSLLSEVAADHCGFCEMPPWYTLARTTGEGAARPPHFRPQVQVLLYEQVAIRTGCCISGCDEYMNLVLADTEDNRATGLGHTKSGQCYAAIKCLQLEMTDEARSHPEGDTALLLSKVSSATHAHVTVTIPDDDN